MNNILIHSLNDLSINEMEPEIEEGNIEYKRKLSMNNISRFSSLITQMKWRATEGNGEAQYYLGIQDDGQIYQFKDDEENDTINTFISLTQLSNMKLVKLNKIKNQYYHCIIHEINELLDERKIIILGNENSGKTTFLSYLMHEEQDDGDGYLRNKILTHDHELISGKTTCTTVKSIGYNNDLKQVMNYKSCLSLSNIKKNSDIIFTFFDVPVIDISSVDTFTLQTHFIQYMDHILIMDANDGIEKYVNIAEKYNITYTIIHNNFDTYYLDYVDWHNIAHKNNDKNGCLLVSIISYDCEKYLVCCMNMNNYVQVDNKIIFTNFEEATVISIRYFNKHVNIIDKNVVFTALLESKNNLKRCKGNFFYSV